MSRKSLLPRLGALAAGMLLAATAAAQDKPAAPSATPSVARRDAQQRVLPKRQRDYRRGVGSTLAPDTANPRAL
jgi:hypothetical protein